MTGADEAAAQAIQALEDAGIAEHELAGPIFGVGDDWVVMLGEHNDEDGFCWCQPGVLVHGGSCPGHAVHRDILH